MALHHLIFDIDAIIADLPDSQRDARSFVCDKIKAFIFELLKDEENITLLTEVITYIENLKIPNANWYSSLLWSSPSLKSVFLQNGKAILNISTEKNKDDIIIPESFHKELEVIHTELMNYYRLLNEMEENEVWRCDYVAAPNQASIQSENKEEKSEKDEIELLEKKSDDNEMKEIEVISHWENSLAKIADKNEDYISDFIRDIAMQGKPDLSKYPASERREVMNAVIDKFCDDANAYDTKDKPMLQKWLKKNGGSDIDDIMFKLFAAHEFTTFNLVPFVVQNIERTWFNHKGKMCLTTDMLIYSLINADFKNKDKKEIKGPGIVFIDPQVNDFNLSVKDKKQVKWTVIHFEDMETAAMMIAPLQLDATTLKPMMRITATMELTIEEIAKANKDTMESVVERICKPKIKQLKVVSFTDYLSLKLHPTLIDNIPRSYRSTRKPHSSKNECKPNLK